MARKPKRKLTKAEVKAAADRAEARSKGKPVEIMDPDSPLNPPVMGRPTKYKPEFVAIARAMCRLGATDYDLAAEFEVDTATIWRWQTSHADFCKALMEAKEGYDDRVERSLAQRAIGYTYSTEKVFQFQGEPLKVPTNEHVPPDPGAAKLWLTNRRPKVWRETTRNELSGPDGKPIEVVDKLALARWIAFTLSSSVDDSILNT